MSDWAYFAVGVAIGLGISVAVIWSRRAEVKQAWADLLGIKSGDDAVGQPEGAKPPGREWTSSQYAVGLGIAALIFVSSAALVVVTDNQAVRVASIAGGVIAFVWILIFAFGLARPGSSS